MSGIFLCALGSTGGGIDYGAAAIRCLRCSDIILQLCRAGSGTGRFLLIAESPADAKVRLVGNDFTSAQEPVVCDVPCLEAGNLRL